MHLVGSFRGGSQPTKSYINCYVEKRCSCRIIRIPCASYFVSVIKGYAEVGMNKVTVLAEVAERAEDVDIERAEKALDRAKSRMSSDNDVSSEDDSVFDFQRAELALKRASTRISVARESGLN